MIQEVAALIDGFVAEHGGLRGDHVHLLGTSGTVTTIAGVHLELRRYSAAASTAAGWSTTK